MMSFYDYKELINERTCFDTLVDFLGYKKALKLLRKLPKEEIEYVLETDDITRIMCTKEYEEMRNKEIRKMVKRQNKKLDDMYNTILYIKESIDKVTAHLEKLENEEEDDENNNE